MTHASADRLLASLLERERKCTVEVQGRMVDKIVKEL